MDKPEYSAVPALVRQLQQCIETQGSRVGFHLIALLAREEAVTLRVADMQKATFEIDVRSRVDEKAYRFGEKLNCSYRSTDDEQSKLALQAICDHIVSSESEYMALFALGRGAKGVSGAEAVLPALMLPLLAEACASIGVDELACTAQTRSAIGVRAKRKGDTLALVIKPRGSERNPYWSGKSIDVCIEELPLKSQSKALLNELIEIVMANELEGAVALQALGASQASGENQTALKIGQLSTVQYFDPLAQVAADAAGTNLAVLYLRSPCFANCVFCGEHTTRDYSLVDVDSVLSNIAKNCKPEQKVLIVGWEPLSHPGVPEMIAACRAAGAREVELMTTGVPLDDRTLVDALISAGLTSIAVPLYSHEGPTNDDIMRKPGAFASTVSGLDRIAQFCEVHVHSLILRQNLEHIDPLFDFVSKRWNATFVAGPVRAKESFSDIAPSYDEIRRVVKQAPVIAMPLCLYPRMIDHQDFDSARPLQHTIRAMADCMRFYFSQGLRHMDSCARCSYRDACLGIIPEQLTIERDLKLAPFVAASKVQI